MKVAAVSWEQALTLDPAAIAAGQAIAVPVGDVNAFIGPAPTDVGVTLLQAELRDHRDQPLHTRRVGQGGASPGLDCVRVAPATRAGLQALLAAVDALARNETLHPVRSGT